MNTYGAEMTFFERLMNVWSEIDNRLTTWNEGAKIEALFREYYPNLPDFKELADVADPFETQLISILEKGRGNFDQCQRIHGVASPHDEFVPICWRNQCSPAKTSGRRSWWLFESTPIHCPLLFRLIY